MTATFDCPNGHQSATGDYCDQCGAKIAAPAVAAQVPAGSAAPEPGGATPAVAAQVPAASIAPEPGGATPAPSTGPLGAAQQCPTCGAGRVGSDRFCEGCGYDFVSESAPAGGSAGAAAAGQATATGPAWDATVSADRAYFDQVASPGVDFPPHCPDRSFPLAGAKLRIGRRSTSRGIYPEIDLSGAPEDSAVSHLHALLVLGADGSYNLLDPGSTNGTTVNDSPDPIAINTPIPLADGDRVHLGAWTTITIRARPKVGS